MSAPQAAYDAIAAAANDPAFFDARVSRQWALDGPIGLETLRKENGWPVATRQLTIDPDRDGSFTLPTCWDIVQPVALQYATSGPSHDPYVFVMRALEVAMPRVDVRPFAGIVADYVLHSILRIRLESTRTYPAYEVISFDAYDLPFAGFPKAPLLRWGLSLRIVPMWPDEAEVRPLQLVMRVGVVKSTCLPKGSFNVFGLNLCYDGMAWAHGQHGQYLRIDVPMVIDGRDDVVARRAGPTRSASRPPSRTMGPIDRMTQ